MLFNSYIFIFAFLPITYLIYWTLRRLGLFRVSLCFLTIASLVFYSYQSIRFGFILIASVAVNYGIYKLFGRFRYKYGRLILSLALTYNFGILFYFKYMNFFAENLSLITGNSFTIKNIVLPLGISFYTFQQVSFVIDAYHDRIPDYKFHEYALFVCFFPQLIAGPIVLHTEMVPQFRSFKATKPDLQKNYSGLQYFILGLGKKILIADALGRGADFGYGNILWLNTPSAIITILLYTLQIYFDFSGYCDMAIGLGKLFGFDITTNFDSPYKSVSVTEFWKRWHITLTRFFTTYLYIPLGGNRKGKTRTLINVMIVFLLSGLWHGSGWNFILWGGLHGLMMVFERILGKEKLIKIPKAIGFIYTFSFVNLAWVFFRADTIENALNIFKRILHGGFAASGFGSTLMGTSALIVPGISEAVVNNSSSAVLSHLGIDYLANPLVAEIYTVLFIVLALYLAIKHINTGEIVSRNVTKTSYAILVGMVFIISVIAISSVSAFLYFNF